MVTAVLAAVVTIAALVVVRELRPENSSVPGVEAAIPAGAPTSNALECGDGPCAVVATQTVGGDSVALMADAAGGNGRLRAGAVVLQTTVTELGAKLSADSLTCVQASTSACIVDAPLNGGRIAQLFIDRADGWRSVDKPYFSAAGAVALGNVSGSDAPEITVVDSSPVVARVYALDGSVVGCTKKYSYASQLRGWPNIRLQASDLRACS
ncbi:hypothetical protein FPZ12_041905 [Amycolatopsis acidicola]|uniref:Uncharacterized protein n=1 Tax=Amycolatopsis acidicola TaxID=2596893 RepID=A0A5N0UKL8_9PSEU|nr:hypothetical protein FPZ12_041905 [Amycolatopsis acidicola]